MLTQRPHYFGRIAHGDSVFGHILRNHYDHIDERVLAYFDRKWCRVGAYRLPLLVRSSTPARPCRRSVIVFERDERADEGV